VRRAAAWSVLTSLVGQLAQVSVTVLVAVILGPERFGIVVLASLYVLLMDRLIRQGVTQAIVQRRDLLGTHLDSAFVMTTGSALVLSLATLLAAPSLSAMFDTPALSNLLRVLVGVSFLRSLGQIPVALLERDLEFGRRALILNTSVIVGATAGIASAFSGANEYAIAYQFYTQALVGVVMVYRSSSWRPRLSFDLAAAKDLLPFSLGALITSIGSFLAGLIDTILLGVFFGPLAVGLYRLASRVVDLVLNIAAGALGSVSLSALSRVQDDPLRFGTQTNRLIGTSAAFTAPILGIVLVGARVTVELFGPDWEGAAPVMRILALAGIARVLVFHTGPIQQASGHPYRAAGALWFAAGIGAGVVSLFGAMLVSPSSNSAAEGVALARLVSESVFVVPAFFILTAIAASTSVRSLLKSVAPALMVTAATIMVGLPTDLAVAGTRLNLLLQGAVIGFASGTTAVVGILLVNSEARLIAGSMTSLLGGGKRDS